MTCVYTYIHREPRERDRETKEGRADRERMMADFLHHFTESMTDHKSLAQNILRCFHTKEFWNAQSHWKVTAPASCAWQRYAPPQVKIKLRGRTSLRLKENYTLNNSANSKAEGCATVLGALTAGRRKSNARGWGAWDAYAASKGRIGGKGKQRNVNRGLISTDNGAGSGGWITVGGEAG